MGLFGKKQEKYILFACIENAGRSQMAEGFFRKYAPKGWNAMSGGTSPKIICQSTRNRGNERSWC